ncbi:uncharacterized protein LOC105184201 isoform X2 [Harpegnathos saltator]|uniref:uncharacterized protein LOC105184201 isoform X2 n=1 Tax=Harpegnathos saltator TaxID=610380 RepID=UPI000DBEDBBB|nr:uncharacterized protein LOC105184201 isoform X2 [Harpegnathos saltator]
MLSPTSRPGLYPGTGYLIGPRVPHGLAAAVEGLTREVLRYRPEDIYVFAARHFEKLLKLREQYHDDDDFTREFNLWPTKESGDAGDTQRSRRSLDKEAKILERRGKTPADVEESPEDVSVGREKRKSSKQTCSKSSSNTRRASRRSTKDKDTPSEPRATKIISQMTVLRSSSKTILTKDIKQELRKNKLNSGEKGKLSDSVEKGIRCERRSRTKVKMDKSAEEEIERTAMMTAGRTSTRRPLKKARRIETESETETDREIATRDKLEDSYERASVKGAGSGLKVVGGPKMAAWLSEHSSERKVSSRALSMDRIRAYVLRKFASSASLEVLRSPTYVEQVQEVIDRAAPIIKEKLEEMRRPRGKRSRSVDFAWNEDERFRRCPRRDSRKCDHDHDDDEDKRRGRSGDRQSNDAKRVDEAKDQPTGRCEVLSNTEDDERRPGRRSTSNSGRRSRRRESGGDDTERSNKSEHEPSAGHDTLEARLTATQSILEGISMSTSELNGRKVEPGSDKREEPSTTSPDTSDHANVVSLPIVRPPSSRSCRNGVTKNGSNGGLILPPISPEAPKSIKRKDELSLPVLSASGKRSQEQDIDNAKVAEDGSTMRDVTSDMEDIATLPKDGDERNAAATDATRDPNGGGQDLIPGDGEGGKGDEDAEEEALWKDTSWELTGKRMSDASLDRELEERRGSSTKSEEKRVEEVYKDSLNVTPEVTDVPPRPDSLEFEEDEREKLPDDSDMQNNTLDGLKDRLIEIEMVERNIEKALAGQQVTTCNDEAESEGRKSTSVEEMNEARRSSDETQKIADEVEKSMNGRGTSNEEEGEEEKEEGKENSAKEAEKESNNAEKLTNESETPSEKRKLMSEEEKDKVEESANKVEEEINNVETPKSETENLTEMSANDVKISSEIKRSEEEMEMLKSGMKITTEGSESPTTVATEELNEEKGSKDQIEEKDEQFAEVAVHGTDDEDDVSNSETMATDASLQTTSSGNTAAVDECSKASPSTNGNSMSGTKGRKKREVNELPPTTPLSLKIPFSYVLSEGSPCEIPDTVTTVIIPDRPCPSPVIPEIEDRGSSDSTNRPTELTSHDSTLEDVSKDETQQDEYDMNVFGEYIRPEVSVQKPVDIDFVHGARSQDIVITHQDLDRIKEEGEEEEEDKENDKQAKEESHLEKKEDEQAVAQAEGTMKLEDIAEHEENETDVGTTPESTNVEEIPAHRVHEYEASADNIDSIGLTNASKTNIAMESRSTSEENGSSQDIHTMTTSSDAKESTASNQSAGSSSIGRPIVPELNLDSLQDNTVSSFKMTANGTATKGSNDSPRESDATMSLIEPLTPDERLTMGNRLVLADRELETPVEESLPQGWSDVPEADQLYQAEQAEYELLNRDSLSPEAVLDETKVQEKKVDDTARVSSTLREKRKSEELDSEEEIAKELIGLLDKEAQLSAEESDRTEKRSDDHPAEVSLDVADGTSQPLSDSMHSVSVDEAEKEKEDVPSEQYGTLHDEDVVRSEVVRDLSSHLADSSQENEADNKAMINEKTKETRSEDEEKKHVESSQVTPPTVFERDECLVEDNETTNQETEETKLEVEEKEHVEISQLAPLAEFEQDEFQEENGGHEIADEKIAVERNGDVIDDKFADNQKGLGDEQMKDVPKSQNNDSVNETEEFHEKPKEDRQEESEGREHREEEDVEVQIERQHEESKDEEKHEQEVSKDGEKHEREESMADEENKQQHVEVLEATKSREDSLQKSTEENEDAEHAPIESVTPEESIVADNHTATVVANRQEEKIDNSPAKLESVHGPITSAISEQSSTDHHGRYWTTATKSSTAETVIAAFGSSTSTDEKTKALDEAPKIMENGSIVREKDDFHSAVVKIQACIRGFLARRRRQRDLRSDSISNDAPLAQETAVVYNEHLIASENNLSLREARSGRHRLRREEALRKTTLSLENAFATSRLQHTGEFHDSVPLPLFDLTNSETNSDDSASEPLDKKAEEVQTRTDAAKSSACEATNCHDDERHGRSQKSSNAFADRPELPIVMQLLADVSRNCHFRINRNSDPDMNLSAGGAKLIEPALDILMLGYPRDEATLQNRYLNFITSVEDVGSNMDYLPAGVATKSTGNMNDAQASVTSGETSVPESLREPLALPGTLQGVVIEELTSLDEAAGDVLSAKSESTKQSTATKTSLDTSSSVPLEEYSLEKKESHVESSPRTNSDDKGNVISDRKKMTVEEVETRKSTEETSPVDRNLRSAEEVDLHAEDASETSNAIFHDSNRYANEEEKEKT